MEITLFEVSDYDDVATFWREQEGVGLSEGDDKQGVSSPGRPDDIQRTIAGVAGTDRGTKSPIGRGDE